MSIALVERITAVMRADHIIGALQGHWTYADYVAIPDDGHRYEVINGVLYMAPAPTIPHQRSGGRFIRHLMEHVEDTGIGIVIASPVNVELAPDTVVQPNIVVVLEDNAGIVTYGRIVGAPDLVVEIASPSTADYDRREKQDTYAAAGVREYWIADPFARTVEVLALEGNTYRSLGVFANESTLTSRILPELPTKVVQFSPEQRKTIMRWRPAEVLGLLKETAWKWNEHNCLRLGASLSYYTVFSLFPLVLVILTILQLVLNNADAARDAILNALAQITGGFRDDFISVITATQSARNATGIIGVATLILGASWVFGELVSAFNIIWGVEAPAGGGPMAFVRVTFFSFALVFASAFLLLVSMIISAALVAVNTLLTPMTGGSMIWWVVHSVFTLLVLTLVFAFLLKYLPQTAITWRDVWLGALFTAIIWTVLQFGISYYIAENRYNTYGAIGAMMALIVWVYLSSQVLFLGGEFTAAYARRYGSRS